MSKMVDMDSPLITSDAAKEALRALFDEEVLNHGSYNVVFAHDHAAGSELAGYLIGYRFSPLEMVIVPMRLSIDPDVMEFATPVTNSTTIGVDLTNLVDLSDLSSSYRVSLSTERVLLFEVSDHTLISWPVATEEGRVLVELNQADDADDFHVFMHQFFDRLDQYV